MYATDENMKDLSDENTIEKIHRTAADWNF
jgi:hypothetical protein